MSQSSLSEAAMTRLNPNGHHISIVSSQTWEWVGRKPARCQLSAGGRARLSWMEWHERHGCNVTRTCERFDVSRPTFYRWLKRFRSCGAAGLENRSHRPHTLRSRTWTPEQIEAVRALRERHPRWSRDKLQVVLRRQGVEISASMVGRIITYLRARGVLREPIRVRRLRRQSATRPHARRKPSDWVVSEPGDLVQIDTKDVRPAPGKIFKHLSLVDVTSRYAVAEVGVGATANATKERLERMLDRLPFPVRALQIDGGSEFKGAFEEFCQEREYQLFVLPPRSPKLNGCVERLQRTFDEEFYQCSDAELRVQPLGTALREYETVYNTVRPHYALGYQTPQERLDQIGRLAA